MPTPLTEQDKADMAREFEQAVADVLVDKTTRAAGEYNVKTILLAGGVAANKTLRARLQDVIKKKIPNTRYRIQDTGYQIQDTGYRIPDTGYRIPDTRYQIPATRHCTDNAAMVAVAAYFHARKKEFTPIEKVKIDPNWQI